MDTSSETRKEAADGAQHVLEHPFGEFAGEGVLLAGVVGGEQTRQIVAKSIAGTVRKAKWREALDFSLVLENSQVDAQRDAAQNENGARTQNFQFAFKIRAAIRQLRRQRLVSRRRAARRRGNVGVLELESVAQPDGSGLVGESGIVKRLVKEITGAVA